MSVKPELHPRTWPRLWGRVCQALQSRNALPCVGLVVLAGCFTVIIAPDEMPLPNQPQSSVFGTSLPTVVLDPGHGGRDEGAKRNGLVEKDLTLDLARRTERLLKMAGFPTVLTRNSDYYVSLGNRAKMGNEYEDALFVSIHFNHDRDSSSTGIESFYARQKISPEAAWTWIGIFSTSETSLDNGENLAGAIQAAISARTDARNRGIRARDLYVVRHVKCPAVLIEGGFLSNPLEAQLLANESYRERIAVGIAEGVMGYQKSRPRSAPEARPLASVGP